MVRRGDSGRLAALVGAALLLTGCSSTGSFFGGSARDAGGSDDVETAAGGGSDGARVDTAGLAYYFDLMLRLTDDDALTRAEAFNDARDGAEFAPTTSNRLSYALALSVPGHAGSDPAAAAERLRDLIAAGDALLPEERMLARIQLRYAEQLEVLEGNRVELQAMLDAARAAQNEAAQETIRGLQAQNAELRAELENATEMLDAITRIEESISEREDQ